MSDNVIHAQFGKRPEVHVDGTPIDKHCIDTTEDAIGIFGEWLMKWPLGDIIAPAFTMNFANAPVQIWAAIRASWDQNQYLGEFMSNYMGTIGRKEGDWHTALTIAAHVDHAQDEKPAYRAELFAGLEKYLNRFGASAETCVNTDPWTRVFMSIFNMAEATGHAVPRFTEEGDSLVCMVGVMNSMPSQPRLWYKITYTLNGAARDFTDYCNLESPKGKED